MFLFNETVGQRDCNEVASCLYKFFTYSEIGPRDKKNLILWSENCGGQNKNQAVTVLAMLLVLIAVYFRKLLINFLSRIISCLRSRFCNH